MTSMKQSLTTIQRLSIEHKLVFTLTLEESGTWFVKFYHIDYGMEDYVTATTMQGVLYESSDYVLQLDKNIKAAKARNKS
jgi:hypothetical protein